VAAVLAALLTAAFIAWQHSRDQGPHYLHADPQAFAAAMEPPPATNSSVVRAELEELLAMQATRTQAQAQAARDDRKTRIVRFYEALGLDTRAAPPLPTLERLAARVENDVQIHVRTAKRRFRRLRPYEIEPRLEPCIDDVRGDLSYPSGHASYGYAMGYLLAQLVPERAPQLLARADEYARQRLVCGVHFRSDLEAGRLAARRLLAAMEQVPEFQSDRQAAAAELRQALGLPP
jgi:acid phosphatase (class A)